MPAKNIRISGGKQIVVPNIISSTPSEESVIVSINTSTYSGKESISSYRITTNPSNIVVDSGSPNVTVTGLVPGTSYTFNVRVTNSTGIISETSAFGSSATPFRFKAGYNAGGYDEASNTNRNTIVKITQQDVVSTLSATLDVVLRGCASFSNSPGAGYTSGGEPPSSSAYRKIDINTETRSNLSATLPVATFAFCGTSNNNIAGYNFGGYTTALVNRIDKLLFSSETRSTLSSVLSSVRINAAAMSKGSESAYIIGGREGVGSTGARNLVETLSFSTETMGNLGAILRSTITQPSALTNGSSTGYICGGQTTAASNSTTNVIDKFNLSTNTRSALTATLTSVRCWASAFSFEGSHAFIAGGQGSGSLITHNTKDKLTFSTDTISSSANLPLNNRQAGFITNTGIL